MKLDLAVSHKECFGIVVLSRGHLNMCKAVQDLKESGRREGRREGRKECIEKLAANAIRNGMKHSDVCAITGLSLKRISQIASGIALDCNA